MIFTEKSKEEKKKELKETGTSDLFGEKKFIIHHEILSTE